METNQIIHNCSGANTFKIEENSIDLTVTSPPYPMVEMWDDCFKSQNEDIKKFWENKEYLKAWYLMHSVLDSVWLNVVRVTKPGGIVCINIGDATRTLSDNFQLFSNKTMITKYFIEHGFIALPEIIWRKRTNAPNKFMGSGMYAPGAYVTLEHEFILIFRKGAKREFHSEIEKQNRRKSGYFYNERNIWFSDLWEFQGVSQKGVKGSRDRNGSYPLELPLRLINMFSVQNDVVLDPFAGLGTTMMAAIINGRNSINFEIDPVLCEYIKERVSTYDDWNLYRKNRLTVQKEFMETEKSKGKESYYNDILGIPVKTRQEKEIYLPEISSISVDKDIKVVYN